MIVYLALGSNLGDRAAEIRLAIETLAGLGRVAAASPLYETLPEGGAAQPRYLNAAVRLETTLPARALLLACLAIERARGRVRSTTLPKASRTLDIDLLLYGDEVLDEPGLRIPHPALLRRPFVRIPLADVALPGLCHPGTGEPLDRAESEASVRRVGYAGSSPGGSSS
jgi:2-amino-4-hydroxy-6-hydroxymethyldihydropteridine diphosphokinase